MTDRSSMKTIKEHCIIITGSKDIRKKIMDILWSKYYYEQKKKEYKNYEMMGIKKKVREYEKQPLGLHDSKKGVI